MVIKVGQFSPYISPYVLRLFVFTAVAVLAAALVFSVVIFGAIRFAHPKAAPVLDLPPEMMPGSPLPGYASCVSVPYPPSDTLYCHTMVNDTLVYFMFSPKERIISRLSYSQHVGTLGDLILAWGTPTGMNRLTWAVEVHWDKRIVYVSDDPFAPDSCILYVAYNLEAEYAQPWRGFVNDQN